MYRKLSKRCNKTHKLKEQKEYDTGSPNIKPGKDIKEEPIHRLTDTRKYGTRPNERSKDQNGRYCDAPNWNPNRKCPARESKSHNCKKQKQRTLRGNM